LTVDVDPTTRFETAFASFSRRSLSPKTATMLNLGGDLKWNSDGNFHFPMRSLSGLSGFISWRQILRRKRR